MADVAAPTGTSPSPAAPTAPQAGLPDAVAGAGPPSLLFVRTVCIVAGAVLSTIGGTDAATAETFPSKVFGAGLLVAGVALLATAAGLRSERPWPGTVGSAALAAAALVAAYVAAAAWDEALQWALAFAGLAAGAGSALVLLVRERRPVFGVKSASILGVAGFAFTFFQFTYAQSATTRVGSTVVLTPEIALVLDDKKPVSAAVTIRAANKTGAKVQTLGSLYVVEGIELCERRRDVPDQTLFGQVFATGGPDDPYTDEVGEKKVTAIQAGRVFDDGTYFEPGEEIVRRMSVPVRPSTYDVLRLRIVMAVANGDRLHLGDVADGPAPIEGDPAGEQGATMTWTVSETNLVSRIAHDDRYAVVRWESGDGKRVAPSLDAYVRRAGDPDRSDDLSDAYGLAFVTSSVDIPVDALELPQAVPDPSPHPSRKVTCERDW